MSVCWFVFRFLFLQKCTEVVHTATHLNRALLSISWHPNVKEADYKHITSLSANSNM